ncbi:MAG: site-specific integrase [Burkholderiaceae bacterium]|nr:site-specific integrase [Burkholderiaceae bacterium]
MNDTWLPAPVPPSAGGLSAHPNLLELDDDLALRHWLDIYAVRSQATWRSYRNEAERFRLFLRHNHPERTGDGQRWLLRDASELDVLLYESALAGTPMAGVLPGLVCTPVDGKGARRPFSQPLQRSSINQALSILNAMYEHWRVPDNHTKRAYVLSNPVSRVRRSTSRSREQVSRSVPQEAIQAMGRAIDTAMGQLIDAGEADGLALARQHRRRWIFALFFGLWGRRQEICNLRMNSFQRTHSGWQVLLVRKGRKEQTLPVADWVVDALAFYRSALGLPPLPDKTDASPAIRPLRDNNRKHPGLALSAETLYQEVKRLAMETADAIDLGALLAELDPHTRSLIASQLRDFSPHWFRHSGATLAINAGLMTMENASKMLGHSNTSITASMYYHEDREKLRAGLDQMGAGLFGRK